MLDDEDDSKAGAGAARTLGVNVKSLELEDDADGRDDGRGRKLPASRDTGDDSDTPSKHLECQSLVPRSAPL